MGNVGGDDFPLGGDTGWGPAGAVLVVVKLLGVQGWQEKGNKSLENAAPTPSLEEEISSAAFPSH